MTIRLSVDAASITYQEGQLIDLENITQHQFSPDVSQGWIWDSNGAMPSIYYLTPDSLQAPQSTVLTQLQNSSHSGFFSVDRTQGWIWDAYIAMPSIYYLTPSSLAAPISGLLSNLQSGAYSTAFSQDASQGWIWDNSAANPTLYYLSPDSLAAPPNTSLNALTSTYHAFSFNPTATQGWIWDYGVTSPSLYYLSAASPTSPQQVELTYLTNAGLSQFSADVSQGWIWDANTTTSFIYYVSANTPTSPQFTQLVNLLGYANNYQFNADASEGWIWSNGGTAPYIYYLTPDSLPDLQGTTMDNLQGPLNLGFFSQDVTRGWIWDYTIPMPYIYYLTPTSLNQPLPNYQMAYLQSTLAHPYAFSEDATHGWIWDLDIPSPYIYYFSADSPTNPQYTQLSLLTSGSSYKFDQTNATQGWIADAGYPAPYIYYLSAADPTNPQYSQLTLLQNAEGFFFSQDASRGWVWDFNTAGTYIYYFSDESPTTPQYAQLTQLKHETMGRNAVFNADATQGWIWDSGAAPYVYYLSANAPTDPQSVQLTQLVNAKNSAFSADASEGWIWDRNVSSPYIYYLSDPRNSSQTAQAVYWASGLGGIWVNSTLNSLLAFSKALEPSFLSSRETSTLKNSAPQLTADARDEIAEIGSLRRNCLPKPSNQKTPYCVQAIPFGDFIVQKKQRSTPSFTNGIGGVLATFDAQIGEEGLIGMGGAYAFNHVHYKKGLGHANLQEEVGVVYGSWKKKVFSLDAACWGGGYQLRSDRKTAGKTTASAHLGGYLLSSHLELGANVLHRSNCFRIQFFGLCDWANNWQKSCHEKGAAKMSLSVPAQHASLARSEVGLRFYETCSLSSGQLLFVQKGSYINQTPFYHSSASTLFIGSASIFSVTTGTMSKQNLGAIEFLCSFAPSHPKIPHFTLDLQTELGPLMQSYFASLKISQYF